MDEFPVNNIPFLFARIKGRKIYQKCGLALVKERQKERRKERERKRKRKEERRKKL